MFHLQSLMKYILQKKPKLPLTSGVFFSGESFKSFFSPDLRRAGDGESFLSFFFFFFFFMSSSLLVISMVSFLSLTFFLPDSLRFFDLKRFLCIKNSSYIIVNPIIFRNIFSFFFLSLYSNFSPRFASRLFLLFLLLFCFIYGASVVKMFLCQKETKQLNS